MRVFEKYVTREYTMDGGVRVVLRGARTPVVYDPPIALVAYDPSSSTSAIADVIESHSRAMFEATCAEILRLIVDNARELQIAAPEQHRIESIIRAVDFDALARDIR